ncbi:hypothetical protein C1645_817492 [Glomus cerebriforme]|uniref:Uncharacterized protein n=1 Tax=Glomus cerebriforme TaxID=658196 RepID=A0A397T971_9GLOM|nr:hypothetical protein C1645_817492 [Glomus cerebriforme]
MILILARSAISRAGPVIEIGDISEKESKDYLKKRCRGKKNGKEFKISEEEINKFYKLVGGRIVDLKSVADFYKIRNSFESIKQHFLIKAKKKFKDAQILPNDPYYKIGKRIINELLKSKEFTYLAFKRYFHDVKILEEVLEGNVFAYYPKPNTVIFQSQMIVSYIQKNSDLFINSNEKRRK